MPRQRRTGSGAPGQAPKPFVGQEYGKGVEQQRLQTAMPAPNMIQSGPTHVGGQVLAGAQTGVLATELGQATGQAAAHAPAGLDQVLAAAQQHAGQTGILSQPTQRPSEPITAGLSRGPGPGPEALGITHGTPAGDMLRRLSASTGDPSFAELARKAGA